MERIYLIADIGKNAVVNADGVTLLRTIYLVQGTTYEVQLAFYNDGVAIEPPTIADFQFTAKASGNTTTLIGSTVLVDSDNADFPKQFTVVADSDELIAVITGKEELSLNVQIGWSNGVSTTLLAPFKAKVTANSAEESGAYGVDSINNIAGDVDVVGNGGISVSVEDSTITVTDDCTPTAYSTPNTPETKTLTATSAKSWLVNCTNSNAVFILPDAASVAGRTFVFKKIDASAHSITVQTSLNQIVKSFMRLTLSDNGVLTALTPGVYYDETLSISDAGDSITVLSAGTYWVSDDAF